MSCDAPPKQDFQPEMVGLARWVKQVCPEAVGGEYDGPTGTITATLENGDKVVIYQSSRRKLVSFLKRFMRNAS